MSRMSAPDPVTKACELAQLEQQLRRLRHDPDAVADEARRHAAAIHRRHRFDLARLRDGVAAVWPGSVPMSDWWREWQADAPPSAEVLCAALGLDDWPGAMIHRPRELAAACGRDPDHGAFLRWSVDVRLPGLIAECREQGILADQDLASSLRAWLTQRWAMDGGWAGVLVHAWLKVAGVEQAEGAESAASVAITLPVEAVRAGEQAIGIAVDDDEFGVFQRLDEEGALAEAVDAARRLLLDCSLRNPLIGGVGERASLSAALDEEAHVSLQALVQGKPWLVRTQGVGPLVAAGDALAVASDLARQHRHAELANGDALLQLAIGTVSHEQAGLARAPLALLPVVLTFDGKRQRGRLCASGEPEINPALDLLLRRDQGLALPEPDADQDLAQWLEQVTGLLREHPALQQAAIERRLVLGLYGGAAERAYRDLDLDTLPAGAPPLSQGPLAGLLTGAAAGAVEVEPDAVMQARIAQELPVPVRLDDSQLAVLCAAGAAGSGSLTVQGPPGSGKSEMLAALAAARAGNGPILLVCQKQVALEVVFAKLEKWGLGHLALRLYGAHATANGVIAQVREVIQAFEGPSASMPPPPKPNQALERLDAYTRLAERVVGPDGQSVGAILARADEVALPKRRPEDRLPPLEWMGGSEGEAELEDLRLFDADRRRELAQALSGLLAARAEGLPSAMGPFEDALPAASEGQLHAQLQALEHQARQLDGAWREGVCEIPALGETPAVEAIEQLITTMVGALPEGDPCLEFGQPAPDPKHWAPFCRDQQQAEEVHVATEAMGRAMRVFDAGTGQALACVAAHLPDLRVADLSALLSHVEAAAVVENDSRCCMLRDLMQGGDEVLAAAAASLAAIDAQWCDLLDRRMLDAAWRESLANARAHAQALRTRPIAEFPSLDLATETSSETLCDAIEVLERSGWVFTWLRKGLVDMWRERAHARQVLHGLVRPDTPAPALSDLIVEVRRFLVWRDDVGSFLQEHQDLLCHPLTLEDECWERLAAATAWVDETGKRLGEEAVVKLLDDSGTLGSLHAEAAEIGDLARRAAEAHEALCTIVTGVPGSWPALAESLASVRGCCEAMGVHAHASIAALNELVQRQAACAGVVAHWHEHGWFIDGAQRGRAQRLRALADWNQRLRSSAVPEPVRDWLHEAETRDRVLVLRRVTAAIEPALEDCLGSLRRLRAHEDEAWLALSKSPTRLAAQAACCLEVVDRLPAWRLFRHWRTSLEAAGLEAVVVWLEAGRLDGVDPAGLIDDLVHLAWAQALRRDHALLAASSEEQRAWQREAEACAEEAQLAHRHRMVQSLRHRSIPQGRPAVRVRDLTGVQLLRHEARKTLGGRPSLRSLLQRAGRALQMAHPIWLITSQKVAQLLPRGLRFPMVAFDEASQMRAAEAMGALLRCTGTALVCGDHQQLRPCDFFRRKPDAEDDDALVIEHVGSILDLARMHWPEFPLREHYRSRHPGLISWNNERFYGGQLKIHNQAPDDAPAPVRFRFIAEGVWRDQRNHAEAEACVQEVLAHAQEQAGLPAAQRQSLMVITLNRPQADLIDEMLATRRRTDRDADRVFQVLDDLPEPFFLSSIEGCQGREADKVIITVTLAPKRQGGPLTQHFGALNMQGQETRLNTWFSRARSQMTVLTSIRPDNIRLDDDTPAGRRLLRDFLEQAPQETWRECGSPCGAAADLPPQLAVPGDPSELEVDAEPPDLTAIAQEVWERSFSDLPQIPVDWGVPVVDPEMGEGFKPNTSGKVSLIFGQFSNPPPAIIVNEVLCDPRVPAVAIAETVHHEYCHWRQKCDPVADEDHHGERFERWMQAFPARTAAEAWRENNMARFLLDAGCGRIAIRRNVEGMS